MKRIGIALLSLGLLVTTVTAQGIPVKGIDSYPAVNATDGISAGGRLLAKKEVKQTFVSGIHKDYLVVEIAVHPESGRSVEIHGASFVLESADGKQVLVTDQARIAATKRQRAAQSQRTVGVYPEASIGYESGTDPRYSPRGYPYDNDPRYRRRKGVYTRVGVGVGLGQGGPGSSTADMTTMEIELSEKGLPQGEFDSAVAGYLYFPLGKKKRAREYRLVFTDASRELVLELK